MGLKYLVASDPPTSEAKEGSLRNSDNEFTRKGSIGGKRIVP